MLKLEENVLVELQELQKGGQNSSIDTRLTNLESSLQKLMAKLDSLTSE